MAGGGLSGRGRTLRNLRQEAYGIVQLLLLAIMLQLSFPVSTSWAGTASTLSLADDSICSSIDKPAGTLEHGSDAAGTHSGHCIFCLPLLSMAATPVGDTVLPAPQAVVQDRVAFTVAPIPAFAVVLSGDARAPPVLR